MTRVIIVCEGETEREFCNTVLVPHFSHLGILIQAPLIKKTMGGIVKWGVLKKQILSHLKYDKTAFVTTLIDYYGLYEKHEFPQWKEAHQEPNKIQRMAILELGMTEEIGINYSHRYVPYIQLHEFEGLLFSEIKVFYEQIPANELVGIEELEETFRHFHNPELINDTKETSPSHRLERIIQGYNKVVYGNILAEAIGLKKIRDKSPRFNQWIKKIETINL